MAHNCKNGAAPDRSRVSVDDQHEARYWAETIGCTHDELAVAVARVGNSPDAVRREICRHWAYGTVRKTEIRDGREEDRASKRESLTSAPALPERSIASSRMAA